MLPNGQAPNSNLAARLQAGLAVRAERVQAAGREWEESEKPAKITGQQLKVLGAKPQPVGQLHNTTSGANPVAARQLPGRTVGDWVPRIREQPVAPVRRKVAAPPGNWAVIFDNTWYREPSTILFVEAMLKFIGADVAGAVQLFTSFSSTENTIRDAATNLGLTVDFSSEMTGSLSKDMPFIMDRAFAFQSQEIRDRVARWGGVVLSDVSAASPGTFMQIMQCATPEAIAAFPNAGTLVSYIDTGRIRVSEQLIDQPNSPFTPALVGAASWDANRPRLTQDGIPVLIDDADYQSVLGLDPYPQSARKALVSPKPLTFIDTNIPGLGQTEGWGGFFSQINTTFPGGGNYKRSP